MENISLNTTVDKISHALSEREQLLESLGMNKETKAFSYLDNQDEINLASVETLIKIYADLIYPDKNLKYEEIFKEANNYNNQVSNLVNIRSGLLKKLNLPEDTEEFSYIKNDGIKKLLILETVIKTFARYLFNEELSFEEIKSRCLESENVVTK